MNPFAVRPMTKREFDAANRLGGKPMTRKQLQRYVEYLDRHPEPGINRLTVGGERKVWSPRIRVLYALAALMYASSGYALCPDPEVVLGKRYACPQRPPESRVVKPQPTPAKQPEPIKTPAPIVLTPSRVCQDCDCPQKDGGCCCGSECACFAKDCKLDGMAAELSACRGKVTWLEGERLTLTGRLQCVRDECEQLKEERDKAVADKLNAELRCDAQKWGTIIAVGALLLTWVCIIARGGLKPKKAYGTAAVLLLCGMASAQDITQERKLAVCRVVVSEPGAQSLGSGTLISKDERSAVVLTCWHLFSDSQGPIVVRFPNDPTQYQGRLAGTDRGGDLAAVIIAPPKAAPVPLSAAEPAHLERLASGGFGGPENQLAFNRGQVTARIDRGDNTQSGFALQGAARQGDSGGPVFNAAGELVGVASGSDGRVVTACGIERAKVRLTQWGCPGGQCGNGGGGGQMVQVYPYQQPPPRPVQPTSTPGPAGAPGKQGPEGKQGPQGPPGKSPDIDAIVAAVIAKMPKPEKPALDIDVVVSEITKRLPPIYVSPDDKTGVHLGERLPPFKAEVQDGGKLLPGLRGTRDVYLGGRLPINRKFLGK
jgi:hypothetical protein